MYEDLVWYQIHVELDGTAPSMVHYQQEKGELFVGPSSKISGFPGAAYINSRALAEEFVSALKTVYERRYGEGVVFSVVESRERFKQKYADKIAEHSLIIRARLDTQNFVPNVKPAQGA